MLIIRGTFDYEIARSTECKEHFAANVHYHQLHGSLLNTEFSKDHLLAQVNCFLRTENHVLIIITFSMTFFYTNLFTG